MRMILLVRGILVLLVLNKWIKERLSFGNGQRCTAAGRNAGEHLLDYVKLIGNDSAVVVKSPKGELWNK